VDFPHNTDLLIVAGTSLQVGPANGIVKMTSSTTIRLIANNEPVGEFLGVKYGSQAVRDIYAGGECDKTFLELCKALGWIDDLKKYKHLMSPNSKKMLEELEQ